VGALLGATSHTLLFVTVLGAVGFATTNAVAQQAARPTADGDDVARYRLTAAVFGPFRDASRLIGAATQADARFTSAPLFSREVALLGEVGAVTVGLEARLQNEPSLLAALTAAKITAHDYTKFALALIAARLAHGFVTAGVLRSVPPGVTADNVAFVAAHQSEVEAVLAELGVSGLPGDAR
jgi:hypothetical protein